jgi:hypothetical protein
MACGAQRLGAQRLKAAAGAAIVAMVTVAGCSSMPHSAPITATAAPTPAPATSSPPPPPLLTGSAWVTRRHPRTGTKVGVLVSTAPGARITVVAHFRAGGRKKTARADTAGQHTFWFSVGTAAPGVRVRVDVGVSAYGQMRSVRVWFTPRPPPQPTGPAAPAVAFGCNVLQTGAGQEEFKVTTTGGGSYSGTVDVSFYDYPGSGHIFPPTTVQGATPVGSWQPVPGADIGASAEPSGCIASRG